MFAVTSQHNFAFTSCVIW